MAICEQSSILFGIPRISQAYLELPEISYSDISDDVCLPGKYSVREFMCRNSNR